MTMTMTAISTMPTSPPTTPPAIAAVAQSDLTSESKHDERFLHIHMNHNESNLK